MPTIWISVSLGTPRAAHDEANVQTEKTDHHAQSATLPPPQHTNSDNKAG
jgi:hypothetical protein